MTTPTLLHGNVQAGQELPELAYPVTATTIVLGALAARDWRPMHHDKDFAVNRNGTRDIFLNTPNLASWFERYITDWTGPFVLPASAERFYREVGPVDVFIESFGNGFSLPSLARLWPRQAGYRWHALTGEPIADWQDDWLVVADQGGDPFILSRGSRIVLHD